jgi:hypothetical protein
VLVRGGEILDDGQVDEDAVSQPAPTPSRAARNRRDTRWQRHPLDLGDAVCILGHTLTEGNWEIHFGS